MSEMSTSLSSLQVRLLDQCFKFGKHHLGSAFSTLPILKEIFDLVRKDMGSNVKDDLLLSEAKNILEIFIHAGTLLLCDKSVFTA